MRLGIALGAPGSPAEVRDLVALAQEAERLGFATAWTAEAYGGYDAASRRCADWPAQNHADRAEDGGPAIAGPHPGPGRSAVTLDLLSGGRFHLGLGAVGTRGLRGLARDEVQPVPGPHPRVRRGRAAGAERRAG